MFQYPARSSNALTCPVCIFSIHFHRHLLLPDGCVGGQRGRMGRLQLLLIPSADPAGRKKEMKQAGYWVRRGFASAGNWAWEGDEQHPFSVRLTAASPASHHP